MAGTVVRQRTWVPVCRLDQLRVDLGVAALVGSEQVALFRLDAAEQPETPEIRAIGNLDRCAARYLAWMRENLPLNPTR